MTRDASWRRRVEARRAPVPDAPTPTMDQIREIVRRHRLDVSPEDVEALPAIGTVNTALALGNRLVLRIPRPHGVGDTQTESVAAPAAVAAGVTTPALVVYDDSRTVFDVPYTVYERVQGTNFGLEDLDPDRSGPIYREIGRELAILHERVTDVPDPMGYLKQPHRPDPADLLEYLESEHYLSSYNVRWLTRVFDRLRPAVEEARGFRRFLHNDVLPTNVLVRDGRFAALIDWNDCGWGDPALELAALPCRALPAVLEGYQGVAPMDGASTVAHRALWDQLCAALEFLLAPVDRASISWARPPFARLTEIVAMAARDRTWSDLLI